MDYNLTEITESIAKNKDIKSGKLEYQYSSKKGDGVTGIIQAVILKGSNKSLDMIYKISHRDPNAHKILPLHLAYTTEIFFYKEIFPTYIALQQEYNIMKPFDNVPTYLGSVEEPLNEMVAMENLKSIKYDLWDKSKCMDKPHLEAALKTLAKYHGTSFALKHLKPEKFYELTKDIQGPPFWQIFADSIDYYTQISGMIKSLLDIFDPIKEKIYRDKIQYFGEHLKDDLLTNAYCNKQEYDIILHGDCWCNNMMFKYDEEQNSIYVKMLDFQMVRTGSAIIDLAYLFYTIASKDCIDDLDYFLKLYHNTMDNHLQGFGINANDVFPFQKMMEHWSLKARTGLMMCFNVRKMMLLDSANALDFTKDAENIMSNMVIDKKREELYRKYMKDIIMHFVDRNFL